MDAKVWNGSGGQGWAAAESAVDAMFAPFDDLLVDGIRAGERVLDIGCGTGATTLAASRAAGCPGAGVDTSAPMIAAARARAAREKSDGATAQFIRADAETYVFAPEFDVLLSRFGVMFFADPVRAFANLRRATKHNARLRFAAWRGMAENPFMIAAEHAAAPLLPGLAPRLPDAPGQFAFADDNRVRSILMDGGWKGIDITAVDIECRFPESELVTYLTWMGPVGRALQPMDAQTRARVIETVRAAFEPYVRDGEARFIAACWMVNAHA